MISVGDPHLHQGRHPESIKFGFVDADNIFRGLQKALKDRGLSSAEALLFDPSQIFFQARLDRYYLYSAIESGQNPPQWIASARSQDGVVFRSAVLTSAGNRRKQEGVDVRLAVEAMQNAFKKNMKRCTIFSGDGDLIPLVNALVDEGIFTTVASFGNPSKSDVASRLRDAADSYVHIGTRILLHCLFEPYRMTASGSFRFEALDRFRKISDLDISGWEIGTWDNGETVIIKKVNDGGDYEIKRFSSETGARVWFKLFSHTLSGFEKS